MPLLSQVGRSLQVTRHRTNPYVNDISTADTVDRMRTLIKSYSLSLPVVTACNSALNLPPQYGLSPSYNGYSSTERIRLVFNWIKNHVRFMEDEQIMMMLGIDPYVNGGREFLLKPDLMIQLGVGDCDDFSDLLSTMLVCCGFVRSFGRGWLVTIAADERDKEAYTHVYTKWYCPDNSSSPFIYVDASHGPYPGWETDKIYRKREWEIK